MPSKTAPVPLFQTPDQWTTRADHIWIKRTDDYLCGLCGAVARHPPPFPTAPEWVVPGYEKLSDMDRLIVAPKAVANMYKKR